MKQVILGVIMGVALSAQASEQQNQAIAERIKPVGTVCVQGDACASAAAAAPAASSGPRAGADIYAASCGACHAAGVSGAPKPGDAAAWQPRIDQGMDKLLANAISGINAMPAKGLCMDCSDDELQAAIDYMIKGE